MGVFVTTKKKKNARWTDLGPAFPALYPTVIGKMDFLEGSLWQLIRDRFVCNRPWLHVCLGSSCAGRRDDKRQ